MDKKPQIISIEMPTTEIQKIKDFYVDNKVSAPTEHIDFFARVETTSISVYKKVKNGNVKVVFAGDQAKNEANIWLAMGGILVDKKDKKPTKTPQITAKSSKTTEKKIVKSSSPAIPQIGSDEVGTGDYFGPICVCSAYVNEDGLARLKTLGVTDSKKMNDDYILQIGPTLISSFKYSSLSLDNKKYNELIAKGENINTIKAKMHNRCLGNLSKQFPNAYICQDQFVSPVTYYKYLTNEEEVVKGIHFSTKGELAFPSVALASCIARYSFLVKMQKMGEKYGVEFPLGASAKVDTFAKKLIKKCGEEVLNEVAKINFANTKKIK